jgi:hypothetical protein
MNTDDGQRMNMQSHGMRQPMASKYPEKSPNYSPSTSYNYSPQSGFNGGNSQMFQRRRPPQDQRFRRDVPNPNDRLVRQNDIIIRLLKEIRDRLPALPVVPAETGINEPVIAAPTSHEEWDEDQSSDLVPENNGAPHEESGNAESPSSDMEA